MIRDRDSTELERRADAVFERLISLPDAERQRALERECAGSPEVQDLVESLLEADRNASRFLSQPVGRPPLLTADPNSTTLPATGSDVDPRRESQAEGRSLGPYRLRQHLGSGGMGEVFLAIREGDPYRRRVAIKLLRRAGTPELDRRFRTEQQALALLEHPNIARMYDSGIAPDSRPFLVMEYIDGVPIHRYCADHELDVEARLRLIQQVCAAVHFAHRNLIVHRDIKPDNILVDAEGVPKLLDFGIAKLLDAGAWDVAPTRTGLRPMTPTWASPEQVRGEPVTTASDVYSLGALLYFLLVGEPPYRLAPGAPEHAVLRAVCEHQPNRPSKATSGSGVRPEGEVPSDLQKLRSDPRRLRGDLDNIVLMALEKQPQHRYASAEQLSDDLERHLNQLPVRARPSTFRYRATKFIGRHRWAVAAAGLFALVVLAFVVTLAHQAGRLTEERDRAEEALEFTLDLFRSADAVTGGSHDLTAHELLAQGAQRIEDASISSPLVKATLEDAIGSSLVSLTKYEEALPLLEDALAIRRDLFGEAHPDTVRSLNTLAELHHYRGRYQEAEPLYAQALEAWRRLPASDGLARTLDSYGSLERALGRFEKAVAKQREALALHRSNPATGPLEEASTLNLLGLSMTSLGRYDEAERFLHEALELRRQGAFPYPVAESQVNLLRLLNLKADYRGALDLARAGIETAEAHLGADHRLTSEFYNQLGATLFHLGRFDEAESVFRENLKRRSELLGATHLTTSYALERLAQVLLAQGELETAEELLARVLENRGAKLSEDHPLIGRSLHFRGHVHLARGELEAAEADYHRALVILKQAFGDHHQALVPPLLGLGRVYLEHGRPAEAESFLRHALEIRRQDLKDTTLPVAEVEQALGRCLLETERAAEAAPLLGRSATTFRAQLPGDHPRVLAAAELERRG